MAATTQASPNASSAPPSCAPAQSLLAHASRAFARLPLAVRAVLVLCCSLFALQVLLGWPGTTHVCHWLAAETSGRQLYRLGTSAWFHVDSVHLLFNMLAWCSLAPPLERELGTLAFTWQTVVFMLAGNLVSGVLIFLASATFAPQLVASHCEVGLSGVLFALIVLHAQRSVSAYVYWWGAPVFPVALYPWVLLGLTQLLMPGNVSFVGHLAGMLVGYAACRATLAQWLLPSAALVARVERWRVLGRLVALPSFVPHSGESPVIGAAAVAASGGGSALPFGGRGYVLGR